MKVCRKFNVAIKVKFMASCAPKFRLLNVIKQCKLTKFDENHGSVIGIFLIRGPDYS